MVSLGYLKDVVAVVIFIIFLVLVIKYNMNENKKAVVIVLTIGLIVDGIFSIFPKLHNKKMKI